MSHATRPAPSAEEQSASPAAAAIAPTLESVRRSLDKEGAGLDVAIDDDAEVVTATLVAHRIVCQGCLLPEDLVSTMLRKSLKSAGLKHRVETRNWTLEHA